MLFAGYLECLHFPSESDRKKNLSFYFLTELKSHKGIKTSALWEEGMGEWSRWAEQNSARQGNYAQN